MLEITVKLANWGGRKEINAREKKKQKKVCYISVCIIPGCDTWVVFRAGGSSTVMFVVTGVLVAVIGTLSL